jgi:hypothetical protein
MAYTYDALKAMTIAELRDIAKGLDAESVRGWSQMNKDHLLPALARALSIDTHAHTHVEGIDKNSLKARLHKLKADREQALADGDHARLRALRRERHRLNRRIRAHVVVDK